MSIEKFNEQFNLCYTKEEINKLKTSIAKGRPKNPNKNIKFSCTLTPAQLEWLNKTADENGIERSAVLRMAVDKMMFEDDDDINEEMAMHETCQYL